MTTRLTVFSMQAEHISPFATPQINATTVVDNNHYPAIVDYAVEDVHTFNQEHYLTDGASAHSTGSSPIMYMPQLEQTSYDQYLDGQIPYQSYDASLHVPAVEFTDLTAPYQEDRRRRRSHPYDKQTISSMHMRRRAQNRASQRAFRERKEKHAQDLQRQLDELGEKYRTLKSNYALLDSHNDALRGEIERLGGDVPSPPQLGPIDREVTLDIAGTPEDKSTVQLEDDPADD